MIAAVLVVGCDGRVNAPGSFGPQAPGTRRDATIQLDANAPTDATRSDVSAPTLDAATAPADAGVAADATPMDAGSNHSGDPFDARSMTTQWVNAACDLSWRCSRASFDFRHRDRQDCVDGMLLRQRTLYDGYARAIAAGRLTFDRASFDACTQSYATSDCALQTDAACRTIFVGTRGNGEPCSQQVECDPDHACIGSGTCGVCQPRVPRGADCTRSRCVRGSECQAVGNVATCVAVAGEGDTCGGGVGACSGRLQCIDGRCLRPASLGDNCNTRPIQYANCDPFSNTRCAAGVCQEVSWERLGAACSGLQTCDHEGICNSSSRTCEPRPTEGARCAVGDRCGPDLFCDGNGVCQRYRQLGEPCTTATRCISGAYCISGVCAYSEWMECP